MTVPYGPILVVEDIANIRELLEVTLKFKGYPVVSAQNGDEALAFISRERPSLVITDILMPRLDGFAFAYRVRSNPKTRDIPIIFISATYITPQDKAFALSLGAVSFLEKPVETEEFLLTVAEVLTMGTPAPPEPLTEEAFHRGYQSRLEEKLRHKNQQIQRAQRLVETVPEDQRKAFEGLLAQAIAQREEIEDELRDLRRSTQ